MKHTHLLIGSVLLALLMPVTRLYAQKNRAVVRDVVSLMEILNSNYYVIEDVEVRHRSINADRASAVAILRAYAEDDLRTISTVRQTDIDTELVKIREARQKIATWSTAPQNTPIEVDAKQANLSTLNVNLNTALGIAETKLYSRDEETLTALKAHFLATGNKHLEAMTKVFMEKFKAIHDGVLDNFASLSSVPRVVKGMNLFTGGGLTLTNAIDGLATFMAKRIKEELAAQIFDKIKAQLSELDPRKDEFLELKIILPQTTRLLMTVAPEQYQGFVQSLKEAIEQDLNDLLSNLPNLINSHKVRKLVQQNPELELAFLGIQLISDLNKINSPSEFVFLLENSDLMRSWSQDSRHKNFANGIRLASMILYSLTEESGEVRRLISRNAWENYYQDKDFYRLYLGFLMQQDKKYFTLSFKGTTVNSLFLSSLPLIEEWYDSFAPEVTNLLGQAEDIDEQLSMLKKMKEEGRKLSADSVAQLMRTSLGFLERTIGLCDDALEKFGLPVQLDIQSRIYISFAEAGINIYGDLGSKRYFNAISSAIGLADQLSNEVNSQRAELYGKLISDINGTYDLFLNLDAAIASSTIDQRLVAELKGLSTELKSVCAGCTDFDAVLALPAGHATTMTSVGAIATLRAKLRSSAFVAYFVARHNVMLKSLLNDAGMDSGFFVNFTAVSTLKDQMDAVYLRIDPLLTRAAPSVDILKIVNFIAAVSKAQTADDFASAVEAIALPTGSASIKRLSASNISLNSYAGFYGGVERLYKDNENAASFAFTVPIGIALSKSFRDPCETSYRDCKASGSWTIFMSVIDIGAFTAIRFEDGDQALPEIKFKNILAPGLHLIYGIPKTALSIGVGAQMAPSLRAVDGNDPTTTTTTTVTIDPIDPNQTTTATVTSASDTETVEERPAIRYGLSIMLDIPLLNFHTRSKGYRK